MSETKTKNLCTVPAADLTDSQYFIAEDGGELKRIPKAQVVLKKLEKMLATDTENLAGGGEVTAQELLDALAEQVANKLLAKSQVVNNLLATVEGNPLDATQGKALKELIDTTNNNLSNANSQITQLYSEVGTVSDNLAPTLESLSQPPSEYCTFSQWVANAERCGNEVTLSFNISGRIKEVSTIFLLKTIPEKYRPRANKHISYRTQDGYDMAIFIQTDGQIQLFTGGKAVSGFFLRQVITYPAA